MLAVLLAGPLQISGFCVLANSLDEDDQWNVVTLIFQGIRLHEFAPEHRRISSSARIRVLYCSFGSSEQLPGATAGIVECLWDASHTT